VAAAALQQAIDSERSVVNDRPIERDFGVVDSSLL
jgi:hypothetical protein